jgi:FixJ family two-component response regulator
MFYPIAVWFDRRYSSFHTTVTMRSNSSKLTLIVVDDDLHIRRAVGRSLRSYGHQIHLFQSGEEYCEQDCDTDCAIVDIGLPGVSGLEMVERLRGRA